MNPSKSFLYAPGERYIYLSCVGPDVFTDSPSIDSTRLPETCIRGLRAIFNLLEAMIPDLAYISTYGLWQESPAPRFVALDLWLQNSLDGFHLPARSAAGLFAANGIPYFHLPPAP